MVDSSFPWDRAEDSPPGATLLLSFGSFPCRPASLTSFFQEHFPNNSLK